MRINTAVVEILGVRLALAFPDPDEVGPGAGDTLIRKLQPFFPTMGIMLLTLEYGDERSYATFQSAPFLEALNLDDIFLKEIDLAQPLPDDSDPPF